MARLHTRRKVTTWDIRTIRIILPENLSARLLHHVSTGGGNPAIKLETLQYQCWLLFSSFICIIQK